MTSNIHYYFTWYKFNDFDPAPSQRRIYFSHDTNPVLINMHQFERDDVEELEEETK